MQHSRQSQGRVANHHQISQLGGKPGFLQEGSELEVAVRNGRLVLMHSSADGGGKMAPVLFRRTLKWRCAGGDTFTETTLQLS
jgi:hypothetical protein